MPTRILLSTACAALIAGCATIPEDQCARTDWHRLGIEDGRSGYPASRLERHREACAGVQVVPDADAWESGRRAGLPEYCRLSNAVDRGLARNSYEGVCDDARFARLHAAARAVGDARYRIESIDRDLDQKERQLRTDRKLSDKRRSELRGEIRNLERQRDRARDDQRAAERRLDLLMREYTL